MNADPQTGETTGYAVDYSLQLYQDAVNATLHLTPMDGSPERFFTLTTTIAAYPPVKYYHTGHLGAQGINGPESTNCLAGGL